MTQVNYQEKQSWRVVELQDQLGVISQQTKKYGTPRREELERMIRMLKLWRTYCE